MYQMMMSRRTNHGAVMNTLRNHPAMMYGGMRNWPPVWVRTSDGPYATITGEVGILTGVRLYDYGPDRCACFLLMEYQSERYIGSLLLKDVAFCGQVDELLRQHIGKSINEIGDLDLSYTL